MDNNITVILTRVEAECIIQALRGASVKINQIVMDNTDASEEDVDNAIDTAEQKIINEW
jgi:uncharacterized protein (DUF433 family)